MANIKITDLPAIDGTDLAADDVVPVVDLSTDTTKKVAVSALRTDFGDLSSYTAPTNSDQLLIYDATAEANKKITVEDLIAKRARDSRRIYISKDAKASDTNNGTSPEEPFATFFAAIEAASPGDVIEVAPGTYTESNLPLSVPRDVGIFAKSLRQVKIQPASGQEMNGFFKVDSGFWCWGLEFAGHQADTANNQQAWAISFDDQADNTSIGASDLGAYILKSPYIQNCSSVTAEDDSGNAGSTSVGDTGGGLEVDGDKCASNSPIRSMVVDSYTQVNLGGPGCLVKNDGYAQLVSFFGTFCTFHVKTETGGQANLSGGGTTDFGDQGLVADGYSKEPNFTGDARIAAYGADRAEAAVTIDVNADTFTTSSAHGLVENDQITFTVSDGSLPTGLATNTTYYVIASGLTSTVFKVSSTEGGSSIDMTGSATGTYQFVRQGQTTIDVVSLTANRIGTLSRPNPGQLMFPRQSFPSAGAPGSSGNAVTVSAVSGSEFTVTLGTIGYSHEYVTGGTVTVGGATTYNITSATYDHTTGVTTLTATGYTPSVSDSIVLSGLEFICPTQGVYVITGSVPIDASGTTVPADDPTLAGYRLTFFNTTNGGLRSPIAAGQVIDFRLRSQISCALHTMEYVGAGTNYNALPWNGGVPVPANQRVELNNGRVFGATINERGDFEVGDGIFSIDGTTGSATINTSEFNLSGLNFVGPFSRNGGFSTVGVQLREVSDNTSLIASTGAADGNTVPTQSAVKSYVDSTTVQSVDLSVPTGFTSSGGPITGSGSITLAYDSGYQGFTTAEATKLSGIAAGAEVNVQSDWNATSGDALILNKPTIPSGDLVDDTSPQLGGNLDLNGYDIVTTSNGDIDLDPNGSGVVVAKGNATRGSGQIKLNCEQNTHGIILKGPAHSAAANYTLTFPTTDGNSGELLQTDGSGNLSWSTAGSGTVSSVGLSAPTGFSVTGSPVTASGTLALAYAAGYQGYTTAEATKLSGIAAGAEVNVATDLSYTASTRVLASSTGTNATLPEVAAGGNSGLMTGTDKTKLDGIETGAEVNNSDIYVIACSDETTDLTTGTAKATFRMPAAGTLTAVRASVTTAPAGSALVVDINEAGTSVLSTKLSIDATEKTSTTAATAAVISDSALAADAEITIDIDQIGSTTAGTGLKVQLEVTRS